MPTDWGGGAGEGIARTLADLGRINADRALTQGHIWGGAAQNIGNLIAQAPQRAALQDERQARAMELQGLAQDRQYKAQLMQRDQAGSEALAKAISNPANQGDPDKIYQETAAVSPEHAQKFLDAYTKHSEDLKKLTDAKGQEHQAVADLLSGADPTDAAGIQARLGLAHTRGVNVAPYAQLLDQLGPEAGIKQIVDSAPENVKAQRTAAAEAAKQGAKTREVTVTNPDGSQTIQIVKDEPGQTFNSAPKPSTPQRPVEVRTMENGKPVTKFLPPDQVAGQTFQSQPPASVIYPKPEKPASNDASDVAETIKGMKDGSLPPIMPGRASKEYTALMAEAHRQGYDLSAAVTDWSATQKHIATLNGAQQTRLNQAVNQLPELLDSVEGLAKQWKGGGFPLLNKANLAVAKNGVYGSKAATIANQLDAQIADVNADLATVYMGGNSPTDHGLELASKALNSDWDQTVLLNMLQQARKNVQIRQNSIRNTGVQGASADNPYVPKPAGAAPASSGAKADPLGIR